MYTHDTWSFFGVCVGEAVPPIEKWLTGGEIGRFEYDAENFKGAASHCSCCGIALFVLIFLILSAIVSRSIVSLFTSASVALWLRLATVYLHSAIIVNVVGSTASFNFRMRWVGVVLVLFEAELIWERLRHESAREKAKASTFKILGWNIPRVSWRCRILVTP